MRQDDPAEEPRKRPRVRVEFHGLGSIHGVSTVSTTTKAPKSKPYPYADGLKRQEELQERHFENVQEMMRRNAKTKNNQKNLDKTTATSSFQHENENDILDTILVVQHEPVYTLGTASDPAFLLQQDTGIPVENINRGGEITYHGPGQITLYPVLDLRNYVTDLHWYMRALEQVIIQAIERLDDNLTPTRQDDTTGVWLSVSTTTETTTTTTMQEGSQQQQQAKVAAIGVHARRWITQHGLAVNVQDHCLPAFDNIVPCGLIGRRVTSLNQCLARTTTTAATMTADGVGKERTRALSVEDFVPYLLDAMKDVFQMELVLDE